MEELRREAGRLGAWRKLVVGTVTATPVELKRGPAVKLVDGARTETVEASDAPGHAASLMIHGGFRHLPVMEEGRVAGIISIRDLMRVALADSSPRGV